MMPSKEDLENRVNETFIAFNIDECNRNDAWTLVKPLEVKDSETYMHSLRVCLSSIKIAEAIGKRDLKLALYAGLLHDIGKLFIPDDLLKKKSPYTTEDMERMEEHVLSGVIIAAGRFAMSTATFSHHHIHKAHHPYPEMDKLAERLPKLPQHLITKAKEYSLPLAIADVYDAMLTRDNAVFGRKLKPEETEPHMLNAFKPEHHEIIKDLYKKQVLGKDYEQLLGQLPDESPCNSQGRKIADAGIEVIRAEKSLTLPKIVSRNVMLACALEPLPDKPGCTTRYFDLAPHKSLEMFVAAGINIGTAFEELAQYVKESNAPDGAYRFLYKAMNLSKAKRCGGKINQGMLEFLTPIVMANVLYDPASERNPSYILGKSVDMLKKTTPKDVEMLINTKKLGNMLSHVENKYPVSEYQVNNVFDYYLKEYETEQRLYQEMIKPQQGSEGTSESTIINLQKKTNLTSVVHNEQFVKGFPDILLAYETFMDSKNEKFCERVIDAYNILFKQPGKEKLGIGLAADFIAAALYLVFSYSKEKEIIK